MTKCDVLRRPFASRYLTLHCHRAGDGIDHAGELDQHSVAGRLDDPAIIYIQDRSISLIAAGVSKRRERSWYLIIDR